jgi:hypothetical protein
VFVLVREEMLEYCLCGETRAAISTIIVAVFAQGIRELTLFTSFLYKLALSAA